MLKKMAMLALLICPLFMVAVDVEDALAEDDSELSTYEYADSSDGIDRPVQKDDLGLLNRNVDQEVDALLLQFPHGALSEKEMHELGEDLKELSYEKLQEITSQLYDRKRRGKKMNPDEVMAKALMGMLREMRASGKVQEKQYKAQIETSEFEKFKWRNRYHTALILGVFGAAGSTLTAFLITYFISSSESSC